MEGRPSLDPSLENYAAKRSARLSAHSALLFPRRKKRACPALTAPNYQKRTCPALRAESAGRLGAADRQLNVNLEVLCSVRERPTDPGFKARMIVGHVSATREPGAVEPLQRAKL